MLLTTRSLVGLSLIASLSVAGCDGTNPPDAPTPPPATANPQNHDQHDDHGDTQGVHADTTLSPTLIAGRTVTITLHGEGTPGSTTHADVHVEGDPVLAIRGWFGDEAGEGALKARATGSGGDYHIDLDIPNSPRETDALWIELETAEGRTAGRIHE